MKVKIHLPRCHICQLTIHGRFSNELVASLCASCATSTKNQNWGGLGTRLALRVEFPREGRSCVQPKFRSILKARKEEPLLERPSKRGLPDIACLLLFQLPEK